MREFWKKTATMAAIGCVLGVLVGLGFLLPYGIENYYARFGAGHLALHLAMSGVLGAVNMGSATIYSLEHWGVLRCTATHFCVSMSAMCLIGFSMGWFDLNESVTLWILAGAVVVYFIIWLVMYLSYKRQVRRMNAALKSWKDVQGGE